MHFIGKSYVNTVYKCFDGKKSDHSEKKMWQVYTMHYIGKSYETTVYKCDDEKIIDRFLGQIFSDEAPKKAWQVYTNALHREKLCKHCIQVWRWKKIWSLWKKSVTSVYNALYREKLCNHCIQVWRWKKIWSPWKKKCDKCIQCII